MDIQHTPQGWIATEDGVLAINPVKDKSEFDQTVKLLAIVRCMEAAGRMEVEDEWDD